MALTELQRAAIVAEARNWIRTPYLHQADIKSVGVDCAMLLVRVFVDLGLIEPFDPRSYPADWFLHRSEERYLAFITDRAEEVETPMLGDIMLFRYGRCYSHAGIVSAVAPLTLVHAFSRARIVLEEPVAQNADLSVPQRVPRFYSLRAA